MHWKLAFKLKYPLKPPQRQEKDFVHARTDKTTLKSSRGPGFDF